jgi:transcriptional regulator with PAS, ATPase and Fis domain
VKFFVRKIESEQKKKIIKIEDEVMAFLLSYDFPGNVRELKNVIERMITLCTDGVVTISDMLMPIDCMPNKPESINIEKSLKKSRDEFEKNFISNALASNNWNVAKTAKVLKISTRQLWNKINQYKINLKG